MQSRYLLTCFYIYLICRKQPGHFCLNRPGSPRVLDEEEVWEVGVVAAPGPRHHQEEDQDQDQPTGGQPVDEQPPPPPPPAAPRGFTGLPSGYQEWSEECQLSPALCQVSPQPSAPSQPLQPVLAGGQTFLLLWDLSPEPRCLTAAVADPAVCAGQGRHQPTTFSPQEGTQTSKVRLDSFPLFLPVLRPQELLRDAGHAGVPDLVELQHLLLHWVHRQAPNLTLVLGDLTQQLVDSQVTFK